MAYEAFDVVVCRATLPRTRPDDPSPLKRAASDRWSISKGIDLALLLDLKNGYRGNPRVKSIEYAYDYIYGAPNETDASPSSHHGV
jgi:hypothetical protein